MSNIIYKPARKILTIPYRVYYMLLTLVPFGYLTCKEDMETFVAKILGKNEVMFDPHTDVHYFYLHKDEIPYWREVGKTGYLFGRHIHFSTETQETMLIRENHTILTDSRGAKKVQSYKEKFYNFELAGVTFEDITSWIN